jgi:hypothetical protein
MRLKNITWLRGQDSNLRPRGYEPRELPLLHPASNGAISVSNRGRYVKVCTYRLNRYYSDDGGRS